MRTARVVGLAQLLLAALGAAEESVQAESVASALQADDACANGVGAVDCEVSLRQLRGEATAADSQELARDSQEALALTSSTSETVSTASSDCNAAELGARGSGKLSSSYSRSRDGKDYKIESLVLAVDAQPTMFETIHPEWPIALRLTLDYTAGLNSSIVIGGLKDLVPATPVSSAKYCQMPRPACFGKEHCYVTKPASGWADSPSKVIVQPLASIISVNVTDIIDTQLGSLQVWAVPNELSEDGQWATPEIKVTNWRFFNLGGGAGEDEDDGEEYW